ncbi:MFS transporter [Acuticoccus sp. I52.16.1]|uniref:MFS transporter n=1 Tax=Acuticoccus sp. I52.16.1 TaxID=2928472 RepID=UPI001FD286DB|nr:MFS transporter [Acuticoccus sp. I52.16.1]UOM34319.1 MFS transporter [Acuticoccus sp. I52.16.1]
MTGPASATPPASPPAAPAEAHDASHDGPGRARFVIALTGLMMVLAMSTLDGNIVGPALPRIVSDLGGVSHLSWVMTAFLLTATITTPLYGKLSDMFGRRPLFTVAIALFLAGSILSALATNMAMLIIGRAIQGLGGGGLMTLTQITMSDLVPPSRRASYQGLFGAVFTGCSMIGPPLGGLITQWLSWRWIFYVNVPVGLMGITLLWIGLSRGTASRRQRIDYGGIIVVAVATAAALFALSLGGDVYGWTSPVILGLFIGSGLLFMALVNVERRADNPIIEMSLFRNDIFTVATAVAALVSTAVAGAMAFVPLFLQLVLGMTPTASGLMVTPMVAALLVGMLLGGRLVTRRGRYRIFAVIGTSIAMASMTMLAVLAFLGVGAVPLIGALTGLGLGLGLTMPGITVALQNAVDPGQIGVATSTANFIRTLGSAFGVGLAGAIITAHATSRTDRGEHAGLIAAILDQGSEALKGSSGAAREAVIASYRHGVSLTFAACAALTIAAFLIVLFLRDKPLRTRNAPPPGTKSV